MKTGENVHKPRLPNPPFGDYALREGKIASF